MFDSISSTVFTIACDLLSLFITADYASRKSPQIDRLLDKIAPRPLHGWVASSAAAERAAGLVYEQISDTVFFLWPGYWEWRYFPQHGYLWLVRPEGWKESPQGKVAPAMWLNPQIGYEACVKEMESRIASQEQEQISAGLSPKTKATHIPSIRVEADRVLPDPATCQHEFRPTNEKGFYYCTHCAELLEWQGGAWRPPKTGRVSEKTDKLAQVGLGPGHVHLYSMGDPFCVRCGHHVNETGLP